MAWADYGRRLFERLSSRAMQQHPLTRKLTQGFDIYEYAKLRATLQSAKYFEQNLLTSRQFSTRAEILTFAVSLVQLEGLFLEFGVAGGKSVVAIAGLHTGVVFGFDSFEGLPEDWLGEQTKGFFAQDIPSVPPNVELVKGWFDATLESFLLSHPGNVSFLHVDCDLYSSTHYVLDTLGPRICSGTVILFDEYWNYPGWRQHEFRAFKEFICANHLTYTYRSFVPTAHQVCVTID
jgi:hypothetical protein